MGQRKKADTDHGIEDLGAAVTRVVAERDCAHHHTETEAADGDRHDIAVIENPAAKGEHAKRDGDP